MFLSIEKYQNIYPKDIIWTRTVIYAFFGQIFKWNIMDYAFYFSILKKHKILYMMPYNNMKQLLIFLLEQNIVSMI